MKKRILSLLLAMTLVFAYAVPVAAAEDAVAPNAAAVAEAQIEQTDAEPNGDSGEGTIVSDDENIQKAYDAYKNLEAALSGTDGDALKTAYESFMEITNAFTDEQYEKWNDILYSRGEAMDVAAAGISAACIVDALEKQSAFKADKNVSTAYDFMTAYNICTEQNLDVKQFNSDIETDYQAAKEQLDATVVKVFEAYGTLLRAMEYPSYDEDFAADCSEFEAVLEDFNSMSTAQMEQLAALLGLESAEDAWNQVVTTWVNASTIMDLGAAYNNFWDNECADTANAFIELYERVFLTEGFFNADDRALFDSAIGDGELEATYEAAKELLASDKSDKDSSPATGDDFNAAPFAALMMIFAAVAGLAVRRKKAQ